MDTLTRISPERFEEGLTLPEFMQGMSRNKETFEENYHNFTPTAEDIDFFSNSTAVSRVLVLAEEWCGDVLRYLPALARIAEAVPGWDVRVFYRDQNSDLADHWKKQGQFRSIPVMVFFDDQWNELACFIERPSQVYNAEADARANFATAHPEFEDASLPYDQMAPETAEAYSAFMKGFRANNVRGWQQIFVRELKEKLSSTKLP